MSLHRMNTKTDYLPAIIEKKGLGVEGVQRRGPSAGIDLCFDTVNA